MKKSQDGPRAVNRQIAHDFKPYCTCLPKSGTTYEAKLKAAIPAEARRMCRERTRALKAQRPVEMIDSAGKRPGLGVD